LAQFSMRLNYQILTDVQNYFTLRIRRKFVIILGLSLKIPPHVNCVATLPCEMLSVSKAKVANKTTSVTTHFKSASSINKADALNYI